MMVSSELPFRYTVFLRSQFLVDLQVQFLSGDRNLTEIAPSQGTFDVGKTLTCDHVVGGVRYSEETCPRCLGRGFYYDFELDAHGNVPQVFGANLLSELILKFVLTPRGSSKIHPGFGTRIPVSVASTSLSREDVLLELRRALGLLALYQRDQISLGQTLLDEEFFAGLDDLSIEVGDRSLDIQVKVRTRSGVSSTLSFSLGV